MSVLDVASGQGDLLRAIHSWATRRGLMPMLSGIDLNPRSAIEAVAATPTGTVIAWKTGDVFDQAPEPKPDFVVSSQFAHHLTDDQVVAFLTGAGTRAMLPASAFRFCRIACDT